MYFTGARFAPVNLRCENSLATRLNSRYTVRDCAPPRDVREKSCATGCFWVVAAGIDAGVTRRTRFSYASNRTAGSCCGLG